MKYLELFTGIAGFSRGIEKAYERRNHDNQHESAKSAQADSETGRFGCADIGQNGVLPSNDAALRNGGQGMPKCIGFAEVDRDASAVLRYRYPEVGNCGDARNIVCDGLPDFDLLAAGFPCQSFSIAGKRQGFNDTRGTLFFEIARILSNKRPSHFVLENVRGLLSHDTGKTFNKILEVLSDLGYFMETTVLNSKDYGVPQNRERVFFIGHLAERCQREILFVGQDGEEPDGTLYGLRRTISADGEGYGTGSDLFNKSLPQDGTDGHLHQGMRQLDETKGLADAHRIYDSEGLARTLKGEGGGLGAKTGLYTVAQRGRYVGDGIEQQLEPRYDGLTNTLTGVQKDNLIALTETGTPQRNRVYDATSICPTVPSSEGRGGQSPAIASGSQIRRLTPIECMRLQGFPDDWADLGDYNGVIKPLSDTAKYRCAGNAVTTNVIEAIITRMLEVGCL